MAIAGQMPKWTISKLNPKYNLCRRSMIINWLITAVILWKSDSWASLMLIVSGYNIIGYMAAPISMGAINSKTRKFGTIVFILIALIMSTIPTHDLFLINISVMALLIVYAIISLRNKNLSIKTILYLNTPIIIYLWTIYFYQNPVFTAIVAVAFYYFVTHPKYVAFCRSFNAAGIDEETQIQL
jgi:hypothetical protein